MQTLPTNLTDEDFEALREVSKCMLQQIIGDDERTSLIDRGLIQQKVGALQITDLGRLCVARRMA